MSFTVVSLGIEATKLTFSSARMQGINILLGVREDISFVLSSSRCLACLWRINTSLLNIILSKGEKVRHGMRKVLFSVLSSIGSKILAS